MLDNKNIIMLFFIVSLIILIPHENIFAEEETIEVEIKYTNGDRAGFNGMKMLVYQDFDKTPIVEKDLESNPDYITLDKNHRYKIEIFVNGIYADVGYVQLENDPEKLNISIPLSGGIKFEVYYNDGKTPIKDATVVLKSSDLSELGRGLTNDKGETTRYWIQSTIRQEDHYIADVYLEDLFLTSYSPLKILAGISNNQKIITNIPKIVDELITINLYDGSKKITSSDGNYKVTLSDLKRTTNIESNVNFRGDAQFSNLKSGTYTVSISGNNINSNLWPENLIHVTGDINKFGVFKNSQTLVEQQSPFSTCNCISFRLDDVQDYWLAETQVEIIELFAEKNIPLTIGVIGSLIGSDDRITDILKKNIEEERIELANHSWNNDVLIDLDKNSQEKFILDTNESIFEIFGVSPVTFIPPENKYNEVTTEILKTNGFTHLSSHIDENNFALNDDDLFYHVPSTTETAILLIPSFEWELREIDHIKEKIYQSISQNGYAVIMMHPQEFSLNEDGEYDIPNQGTLANLSLLLDDVKNMDSKIVTLSEIKPIEEIIEEEITEEEINKDTCNCVAFRLNDVQDYWLNQVQMEIIEVFIENKTPLTIGIIADAFGNDQKIVEFVKKEAGNDKSHLEIASQGIGLTAFTEYDKNEQNENLKKSLELIELSTGIKPYVFIPPQNKFNSDTLEILKENNISHISSSLNNGDLPPFEFKNQEVYRFPQTTSTGQYVSSTNLFEGVSSQQTVNESILSIDNFGFAVISIQSQEFSKLENSTYVNTVNLEQINELKKLIDTLNETGINIVPIGKINSNLLVIVPEWIKNNAGWWADGSIDDKTFVQGIEYLIQAKVIKVSERNETTNDDQEIPEWIKNNAGWWADGSIDDKTFVQGIEYLIKSGIIAY